MVWKRVSPKRDDVHSKHYVVNEDGRPILVFIGGLGAEYKVFLPVAKELERMGVNFILLEPPGFGDRNPKEAAVKLQKAAKIVLDDPKVLRGSREYIYVGHSAASFVAIELAVNDPRRAAGVVMINGLLDDIAGVLNHPQRAWRQLRRVGLLAGLLIYMRAWIPEFILRRMEKPGGRLSRLFWPIVAKPLQLSWKALMALVQHNRCRSAWSHLWANRKYDLKSRASDIDMALQVICGRHDPLSTPPETSSFLRKYNEGWRADVVTLDTGHHSPLEAPKDVATHLARFAASLG